MSKIAHGKVAEIEYTLKLDDGEIADETTGEPISYLHGFGELVPGLEKALEGHQAGDRFSVKVEAEHGFGYEDETLVRTIPKNELPEDLEFIVGEEVDLTTDENEDVIAYVEEVTDTTVCLDFNHPLAGEDLNFDVHVISIRDATEEEIGHGHVHDDEDHHLN